MICITDQTRLTAAGKCEQLVEFIDKIFKKYESSYDPEYFDIDITDLKDEFESIKNG